MPPLCPDRDVSATADLFDDAADVTTHLATKLPPDTTLALEGKWTYVACPPRVGKRGTGLGVIESHADQSTDFHGSGAITSGRVGYGSGAPRRGDAQEAPHRRPRHALESQFGAEEHWSKKVTGGFFGQGPWVSVQINGDWETVRVDTLGDGSYGEYIMTLENSFSEPCSRATHFHWYTMLTKGYGRVRSYGKRVVSNMWSNVEFSSMAGEGTTEGVYGNTRFLTQLRTGFTITACETDAHGDSISPTWSSPSTDPSLSATASFCRRRIPTRADDLYVRGLTRLMPLWPRGVTVQIIVTDDGSTPSTSTTCGGNFQTPRGWPPSSADNECTADIQDSSVHCGIAMKHDEWTQLKDTELQKEFGVYVKWNKLRDGQVRHDGQHRGEVCAFRPVEDSRRRR